MLLTLRHWHLTSAYNNMGPALSLITKNVFPSVPLWLEKLVNGKFLQGEWLLGRILKDIGEYTRMVENIGV
ncbi:MAG: hypothetical protein K0R78_1716 [Pelosinus sp.]|nr:hypothetical protein [Pelosinus sp.]